MPERCSWIATFRARFASLEKTSASPTISPRRLRKSLTILSSLTLRSHAPTAIPVRDELKHTPERKEPLGVPRVSDASANEHRPQSRPCDEPGRDIIRKLAHV